MIYEICCTIIVIGLTVLALLTIQYPRQPDNEKMEEKFVDGQEVPDFGDEASVDLSVVIPAYNEKGEGKFHS